MLRIRIILALITGAILASCNYNSAIMLRTKKNFQFDTLVVSDTSRTQYRIAPRDIINLRLYSNDGFKLIDMVTIQGDDGGNRNALFRAGLDYTVDPNGTVKLPILGRTVLAGYYQKEAEDYLESLYAAYYNNPFIILEITNRRVMVFPGGKGDAQVLGIGENTTLLEGIAMAGGIAEGGKAKMVKLIRKTPTGETNVYRIDLSRIEGLDEGNVVLQRDDIIYIEPRTNVSREVIRDFLTFVSAFSAAVSLYYISKKL